MLWNFLLVPYKIYHSGNSLKFNDVYPWDMKWNKFLILGNVVGRVFVCRFRT